MFKVLHGKDGIVFGGSMEHVSLKSGKNNKCSIILVI